MNGTITNIQRFSLSDGDGIRTTVFFKGCNMKCTWCHNPETICRQKQLMFYKDKCIGCGKCFEVCPSGAHKLTEKGHVLDRNLCVSCAKCSDMCFSGALEMCGKEMTAEQIMKEIRQDKAYYDQSKGGVTFSGGEVMCQRDFAIELAKVCKSENISVAVETNLCFDFDYCKELLCLTDNIMCDIKMFDNHEHIKYTGVSNELVLQNVLKADTLGIPVTVRTPLIPGVTDTEENISAICAYIKGIKNLKRYELLNFNPLGEGKYTALDEDNSFERQRPLGNEKLAGLQKILEENGINYKIV